MGSSILQTPSLIKKAETISKTLFKELDKTKEDNILPSKPLILKGLSTIEKKITTQTSKIKKLKEQEKVMEEKERILQAEMEKRKKGMEEEINAVNEKIQNKVRENEMILQEIQLELDEHKKECKQKEDDLLLKNNNSTSSINENNAEYRIDKPGEIFKLVQSIQSNNTTTAKKAHIQTIQTLIPNDKYDLQNIIGSWNALYNDPMDAPDYNYHTMLHNEYLSKYIKEHLKWRKKVVYDRLCCLGYEYRLRHETFAMKNCSKNNKEEDIPKQIES